MAIAQQLAECRQRRLVIYAYAVAHEPFAMVIEMPDKDEYA